MNKVYVCSKCGKLIITDNLTERYCNNDGGVVMDSGYTEEQWNALPEETRNNTIKAAKDAGKKAEINKTLASTGAAISSATNQAGKSIKSAYDKSSLLYHNVGDKIRTVAKVVAWVGIILSVIAGLIIMFMGNSYGIYGHSGFSFGTFISGLLTATVGSLIAWISSLALYGFGELIYKTSEIAENTRK